MTGVVLGRIYKYGLVDMPLLNCKFATQSVNPLSSFFSKQKIAALSAFAVAPKTLHKKNLASSMLTFAP